MMEDLFYELTVRQRDLAWKECEMLRAEKEVLSYQMTLLNQAISKVLPTMTPEQQAKFDGLLKVMGRPGPVCARCGGTVVESRCTCQVPLQSIAKEPG